MKLTAESRHTKICIHVSCKNSLKKDVLLSLLFTFDLESAIRRVQADHEGLKLIAAHQLLVYKDLNVLGASMHSVKENTEASVFFSNENGLDLIIRKLSTYSCLETSMQCKITTSIYKWITNPLKEWNTPNIWEHP